MKVSELKIKKTASNPLYRLERKLNLKPLIIFTAVAAVLTIIFILLFNVVAKMSNEILEMFKDNKEFYEMFSKALAANDLGSYFVMQASQTWGFIGIIYAMYLGCKLVGGNLKDGSYEMVYSLELSRTKILTTKYIRMVLNMLIFNLVVGVAGFISIAIIGIGKINLANYLLYFIITTIVCLQAGTLSFALSCLFKRKYSVALSIVIAVVLYFIANFSLMGNNLVALEYVTPVTALFAQVISGGFKALNYVSFIVWTIIPIILFVIGLYKFKKSDII